MSDWSVDSVGYTSILLQAVGAPETVSEQSAEKSCAAVQVRLSNVCRTTAKDSSSGITGTGSCTTEEEVKYATRLGMWSTTTKDAECLSRLSYVVYTKLHCLMLVQI